MILDTLNSYADKFDSIKTKSSNMLHFSYDSNTQRLVSTLKGNTFQMPCL
ncbi:hypothetical protein [Helicobacter mastomyrinus]|uniref:Uncharacterized protein n=1 Tax=Helicobacter mastomyrinus TaxID=287948 RepID=A0ABZ3F381_9HELI|nr:hypothetical protein [uncultured Helicobacter sp.]